MEKNREPEMLDRLSVETLKEELGELCQKFDLQVKKETGSTNDDLKQLAEAGETKDILLLCEKQTKGKGRRGRSFYSPEETGLYMSFLLHPSVEARQAAMLTTLAATAIAKAVENVTHKEAKIKWVNDIYVNQKKVCGILTECSLSSKDYTLEYAIVGIGVNIYDPKEGFPEEIANKAGSVMGNSAKTENLKNKLAAGIVKYFMEYYETFPKADYIDEYKNRSFVIGKKVRILPTGVEEPEDINACEQVFVLDIDEECGLLIEHENGEREIMNNGEISIRDFF